MDTPTTYRAPSWLVWTALWIVYIVWGSTYLAIRVAVETIPPLLMGGVRFLVAGLMMLAFIAVRRGLPALRVTGRELLGAGVIGTALLLGGNGIVSIAEQTVPSGLTALIIASVPLWVAVFRFLNGERVARPTAVSVAIGFAGVAMLAIPAGGVAGASTSGAMLIVVASVSWATGSFFSKRVPLPSDPFVSTTYQMLLASLVMSAVGLAAGEGVGIDPAGFSTASLLALAYLVVFGSLGAFTAYTWLLQNAPISKVATYAYVNPVVAVFLGWAILSEQVTPLIIVGAAIVVGSVAVIVRHESVRPDPEEPGSREDEDVLEAFPVPSPSHGDI